MQLSNHVSVLVSGRRWSGSGPVAVRYWVIWEKWSARVVRLGGPPISVKHKKPDIFGSCVKIKFKHYTKMSESIFGIK